MQNWYEENKTFMKLGSFEVTEQAMSKPDFEANMKEVLAQLEDFNVQIGGWNETIDDSNPISNSIIGANDKPRTTITIIAGAESKSASTVSDALRRLLEDDGSIEGGNDQPDSNDTTDTDDTKNVVDQIANDIIGSHTIDTLDDLFTDTNDKPTTSNTDTETPNTNTKDTETSDNIANFII